VPSPGADRTFRITRARPLGVIRKVGPPGAPAAEIAPGVAGIPPSSVSERIEEIDQILLFLVGETDGKALIIEVHHIQQSGCGAIVEVRRAGSQSSQDGAFEPADILALSRDQSAARIGDGIDRSRTRALRAGQSKDRQSGNVQRGRTIFSGVGNADVQRRLDRVTADIGCVVTSAAKCYAKIAIEARDTADVDNCGIEDLFAARDRFATQRLTAAAPSSANRGRD
jgi:hypothetical protein